MVEKVSCPFHWWLNEIYYYLSIQANEKLNILCIFSIM